MPILNHTSLRGRLVVLPPSGSGCLAAARDPLGRDHTMVSIKVIGGEMREGHVRDQPDQSSDGG